MFLPFMRWLSYPEVWVSDFEYISKPGERDVEPVCVVAKELRSGKVVRVWQDEFGDLPPYPTNKSALFVCYNAVAELSAHLALGWRMPERILDLYVEFRNLTNPMYLEEGKGLLGALNYFGLDSMEVVEKTAMRDLVLRGGPWHPEERRAILNYCEADVEATAKLLPAMAGQIDLPRALLRGRFMAAVAHIERQGIPIDLPLWEDLKTYWEGIQDELIKEIDANFNVYKGRTFKTDRFMTWLASKEIDWPILESGRPSLSDETFKEMSLRRPEVAPLRELRRTLGEMRLRELQIGQDGFNRCSLFPFTAKTSRNLPSNTKFVFGPAAWIRHLIKAPEGYGLAYVDWEQQEYGVAAALSGDVNMLDAYQSGDPYLAFGKQAGVIPADATKKSHSVQREQFKACVLGILYGMGEETLALRTGLPLSKAHEMLGQHKAVYRQFWEWTDRSLAEAMLVGMAWTVFNWRQLILPGANLRSIKNFPVQANAAEMLRLALCTATEAGLQICAPVHDAILMMAPVERLSSDVAKLQELMEEASKVVLQGFPLRSESKVFCYPERFSDARGTRMWERVCSLLEKVKLDNKTLSLSFFLGFLSFLSLWESFVLLIRNNN